MRPDSDDELTRGSGASGRQEIKGDHVPPTVVGYSKLPGDGDPTICRLQFNQGYRDLWRIAQPRLSMLIPGVMGSSSSSMA